MKQVKWKSAEHKKTAMELSANWQSLLQKYPPKYVKPVTAVITKSKVPPGRETPKIPSLQDTVVGAVSSKKPMQYTGTKIVGIGTMHKSNAVPIFSDSEAKEISSMRR